MHAVDDPVVHLAGIAGERRDRTVGGEGLDRVSLDRHHVFDRVDEDRL